MAWETARMPGFSATLVIIAVGFGLVTLSMILSPVRRATYADATGV